MVVRLSKNIQLSRDFCHLRSLSIRKSACVKGFCGSGQIISRVNSQSMFQMFALFSGHQIGGPRRSSNMAAPYYCRLYIARNICTNISALGQRTLLKLRELSLFLFIVYNTTIPLL